MRTTIRTIAAMSAAILALVSCTKEPAGNKSVNPADGSRVFTLSFNATKTALNEDGKTPEFVNGDQIKVFNGESNETLPVTVKDGKATVTVPGSISGDFKAVYPAGAWQAEAPYFQVKNIQDGTFANANICLAEVNEGDNNITFNNQTVLFTFDVTNYEGTYIHVIAARDSISNTVVEGNSKINRIIVPESAIDDIQVSDDKTCYVSVYLPQGKTLTCHDISFANGSKIKVPAKENSPVLAINKIFPVDMTSGWTEPYVEIVMTVNEVEDTYKWATKNIGATESNPNGDFFMWGETTGQTPSESTFDSGFSWATYYNRTGLTSKEYTTSEKTVFLKYVPEAKKASYGNEGTYYDDKTVLDLSDDAANANWGGSWRMPTKEEFEAFISGAEYESGNFTYYEVTFPAAGCGDFTDLGDVGDCGIYWTSSLDTDEPRGACTLYFHNGGVFPDGNYRYYGCSVRAISD